MYSIQNGCTGTEDEEVQVRILSTAPRAFVYDVIHGLILRKIAVPHYTLVYKYSTLVCG